MLIEDPEAFKAWMAKILEPICEADPELLATYICALVKRGDVIEDLRASTIAQLKIFLNEETTGFVDLMLAKLQEGSPYEDDPNREDDPSVGQIKEEPMVQDNCVETPGADVAAVSCASEPSLVQQNHADSEPYDVTSTMNFDPETIPIPADEPAPEVADVRPIVVLPSANDQQIQVQGESPNLNNCFVESYVPIQGREREMHLSSSRLDQTSDSVPVSQIL